MKFDEVALSPEELDRVNDLLEKQSIEAFGFWALIVCSFVIGFASGAFFLYSLI